MIPTWHKTLLFALSALSVAGCREPVNLHIRAEPSEQRPSPPANEYRNGIDDKDGPIIKDSIPNEKEGAKPAIKTGDTLLPKMA